MDLEIQDSIDYVFSTEIDSSQHNNVPSFTTQCEEDIQHNQTGNKMLTSEEHGH